MLTNKASIIACAAAGVVSSVLASPAGAITTSSVTIRQGLNGYSGETTALFRSDRLLAKDLNGNSTPVRNGDTVGQTGTQLFADGYNANDSGDDQIFMRFANLFGSGANQIPANAFIIDASLTLTTGTSTNSQSGGPFGIAPVLVPWTTSSTYNTLKPTGSVENGVNVATGVIGRSVASYDDTNVLNVLGPGHTTGLQSQATNPSNYRYSASVAPILQKWQSGSITNNGFTIHTSYGTAAPTTDGWQVKTGTNGTAADRPTLNVTYTTAPVTTVRFQQGVNGYSGTTMLWLRDNNQLGGTDGASIESAFLDGYHNTDHTEDGKNSSDDRALVKFDNIFGSQVGKVPAGSTIVKAYLKVTTSEVGNAQTGEPFQVHQMTQNWSTGTYYSDFSGGFGPMPGQHESQTLSVNYGMVPGADSYFDVTQAVTNWTNGQSNFGFDIRATYDPNDLQWNDAGTDDGWSLYFLSQMLDPSLHPELIISYLTPVPALAGDITGPGGTPDGIVNQLDLNAVTGDWQKTGTGLIGDITGPSGTPDGIVNQLDLNMITGNWQKTATVSSSLGMGTVPEPTAVACLGLASVGALLRRRRQA
jgi:hypothetical protein